MCPNSAKPAAQGLAGCRASGRLGRVRTQGVSHHRRISLLSLRPPDVYVNVSGEDYQDGRFSNRECPFAAVPRSEQRC